MYHSISNAPLKTSDTVLPSKVSITPEVCHCALSCGRMNMSVDFMKLFNFFSMFYIA